MDNVSPTRYPSPMEKLYYTSPYLKQTACRIEKVLIQEGSANDKADNGKPDVLVLTDRTVFYPECGGQPGDRGFLGPYEVVDTRKDPSSDSILVVRIGEGQSLLEVGMELPLVLDWEHRYKYMAMHTAQHMLSGMMYTMFGIGTVAVHLGEDYLTIEVDRKEVEPSVVDSLISAANDVIMEGHKVLYHEMSHSDAEALGLRRSIKVEGDVRIVEIEGVDRIACGGVHVASTSEIRLVYCVKHETIRGHERLYFKCGLNAVEHALGSVSLCEALALKFSCPASEVLSKVDSLNDALNDAIHARNNLAKQLAGYRLKDSVSNGIAAFVCSDIDISAFVQASNEMEDLALCVVRPDKDRSLWLIVLKGRYGKVDFNALRTSLLPMIEAKGGGRAPVFQGSSLCKDGTLIAGFLDSFGKVVGSFSL